MVQNVFAFKVVRFFAHAILRNGSACNHSRDVEPLTLAGRAGLDPRSGIMGRKLSIGLTCILSMDVAWIHAGKLNTILRIKSAASPWPWIRFAV